MEILKVGGAPPPHFFIFLILIMAALKFIKSLTTVPEKFIDELFSFYKETTLQTDFVIDINPLVRWLNVNKKEMLRTLHKTYKLNFDYKETNILGNNSIKKHVLLTPDCFKRIAMLSRSKNADLVRSYFIEIESLFLKYRTQLIEGMKADVEKLENNQKSKQYAEKTGYIYIIKASQEKSSIYKIGRSKDLKSRLSSYNSGNADDVEVMYVYKTDHLHEVEACLKGWLKEYQYRKYKEVYQTNISMIKNIINGCAEIGKKHQIYKNKRDSKLDGGYFIITSNE